MKLTRTERRIRIAAGLILLAFALELVSTFWLHPASFLVLHMIALLIFVLAVAMYLLSLVTADRPPSS